MLATGHYRNGILLSALTADAVAALVAGEPAAAVWRPFGPDRFASDRLGRARRSSPPCRPEPHLKKKEPIVRITVNGQQQDAEDELSLAELVDRISDRSSGIAVALNSEVVPRGSWPGTPVRPGDRIDVVTAVQGG